MSLITSLVMTFCVFFGVRKDFEYKLGIISKYIKEIFAEVKLYNLFLIAKLYKYMLSRIKHTAILHYCRI